MNHGNQTPNEASMYRSARFIRTELITEPKRRPGSSSPCCLCNKETKMAPIYRAHGRNYRRLFGHNEYDSCRKAAPRNIAVSSICE